MSEKELPCIKGGFRAMPEYLITKTQAKALKLKIIKEPVAQVYNKMSRSYTEIYDIRKTLPNRNSNQYLWTLYVKLHILISREMKNKLTELDRKRLRLIKEKLGLT